VMNYALIIFIGLSASAASADDKVSGISATGTCVRKISVDRASISLANTSLQPSPGRAMQEATREHEKLRAALKNLNLPGAVFETDDVQVREDREWVGKKMVSRGYLARIGISVETSDIAKIGDVIAVAGKHSVKDIGELTTFVSKEKYKAEYEDCLENAARNAKDKAQKLAKGAGVKIGKVIDITEGRSGPSYDTGVRFKGVRALGASFDAAAAAEPSPTIEAKQTEITVSATVLYKVD
jgi:uncharacterized protein YggE